MYRFQDATRNFILKCSNRVAELVDKVCVAAAGMERHVAGPAARRAGHVRRIAGQKRSRPGVHTVYHDSIHSEIGGESETVVWGERHRMRVGPVLASGNHA